MTASVIELSHTDASVQTWFNMAQMTTYAPHPQGDIEMSTSIDWYYHRKG